MQIYTYVYIFRIRNHWKGKRAEFPISYTILQFSIMGVRQCVPGSVGSKTWKCSFVCLSLLQSIDPFQQSVSSAKNFTFLHHITSSHIRIIGSEHNSNTVKAYVEYMET